MKRTPSPYPVPLYSMGKSPFGEQFNRRGELIVTPQQLTLLRCLFEAPEQTFRSIRTWAQAALPYMETRSLQCVIRCARRIPEVWVSRIPYGNRKLCALQARGFAIVEAKLPVWLQGVGRLESIAKEPQVERAAQENAEPVKPQRQRPAARKRVAAAVAESTPAMSFGQLLDRLQDISPLIDQADPEKAATFRSMLVDDEIALSAWRARLEREPNGNETVLALAACRTLAAEGRLQDFVYHVTEVGLPGIGEAARQALSFRRWWEQLLALEEVVLAGEARQLGLSRAAERRRRVRSDALRMLMERVVAVSPTERRGQ